MPQIVENQGGGESAFSISVAHVLKVQVNVGEPEVGDRMKLQVLLMPNVFVGSDEHIEAGVLSGL